MKKIDLHVHTIASDRDSDFEFCLDTLKKYINELKIDCIAITNHNRFDLDQFNKICEEVTTLVFPGIEINLDDGHLLLISDKNELTDFNSKCLKVTQETENGESISLSELQSIFVDFSKYILIPHYDKKPKINEAILLQLKEHITAGEVNSPKKFVYGIKNDDSLVPVYFSDFRAKSEITDYPVRQTYISCGEISFGALKHSLSDKNKVSLSVNEGYKSFQIFKNGQELSTGLNVIVGERSSGKSFTLERIYQKYDSVKYIEQFSLLERNESRDEEKFEKDLSTEHSLFTQEFLKEFQIVVNDVTHIDIDENEKKISKYLNSLKKYAKETEKRDSFSKAKLYSEELYPNNNLEGLEELIDSIVHLIENIEYRKTIEKHVSVSALKALIIELIIEYRKKNIEKRKKIWINELMKDIKQQLRMRTSSTNIEELDLYHIAMDLRKKEKFEEVTSLIRNKGDIMKKHLQGFKIVAKAGKFNGAGELKKISKSQLAFSNAYQYYNDPYLFLKKLKAIDGLPTAEYFKYFVKIDYKILNKDNFEVSGGERSEFNLLNKIYDAQSYDILLIDEPESSFDNLFLKNDVNKIIKEISKNVPVVLVTHNSTVGASIMPDYLLCTRKESANGKIEYRIYSGYPLDKELVSCDGKKIANYNTTMDCLEAGSHAYEERGSVYENLKN